MDLELQKQVEMSVDYNERICVECKVIEDEYHIICECTRLSHMRQKYLPIEIIDNPSRIKFIQIISTDKIEVMKPLGIFCHKALLYYRNNVV